MLERALLLVLFAASVHAQVIRVPGEHGPAGPIADLVNVRITAGGARIPWTRDARDMFLFHLDVPAGVTEIEVETTYLAPTSD